MHIRRTAAAFFVWALAIGASCAQNQPPGMPGPGDSDGWLDLGGDAQADLGPDSSTESDRGDLVDHDLGEMLDIGEICISDEECASGLCLFIEAGIEEGLCTWFCSTAFDCPEDYDCIYVLNSGVDIAKLCVPTTLCIDRDEDGYGTGPGCLGRDCDDENDRVNAGHAEICDGLDNNCNELVDDNPTDVNQPCDTGLEGVCGQGRTECDPNRGLLYCVAVNAASSEVCNGEDDDCDSFTDEDEDGNTLSQTCYSGPPGTMGEGECLPGIRVCIEGYYTDCLDQVLPYPEACDDKDNNCDGDTDEGDPESGIRCDTGLLGVCAAGVTSCEEGGLVCNQIVVADDERCDGLDNNCNGYTDEGNPGSGAVCATGQPGICTEGRTTCTAGRLECIRVHDPLPNELCNYLDDNCNGEVDETFKIDGRYALDTACGSCLTDCTAIYNKPAAYGVCTETTTPTCEMRCNGGYFNLNGIPDDGCEFHLDPTAIYVSRQGADSDTCGLGPVDTVPYENRPCQTIQRGYLRADDTDRTRLIVADGEYEETVELAAGIQLLGGYRPDTWERHLSTTATVIRGPQGTGHRKAVIADGIHAPTVFEGFTVQAANATSYGANSYGVYVRNSDGNLSIRNNNILAGMGGPGQPGADGISGQIGANGGNGADATYIGEDDCDDGDFFTPRRGAAGIRECRNPETWPPGVPITTTFTNGGYGGTPACTTQNQQSGIGGNGNYPNDPWGIGGQGGWGHITYDSCYPTADKLEVGLPGYPGKAATDGVGGAGCQASQVLGAIVSEEWQGHHGALGSHGSHGRGGGGGGSGGGQWVYYQSTYDIPGGGGGGGSGGCAGEMGGYGEPGGASFGIFLYFPTDPTLPGHIPQVTGNKIIRNYGGNGGDGGNGGAGGDGGAAGMGGDVYDDDITGPLFCVFGGAMGGAGSRGGHGGGGGGGCGGLSYDIFLFNRNSVDHSDQITSNTFSIAAGTNTGGAAGNGGNSSNTSVGLGGSGQPGSYGNIGIVE